MANPTAPSAQFDSVAAHKLWYDKQYRCRLEGEYIVQILSPAGIPPHTLSITKEPDGTYSGIYSTEHYVGQKVFNLTWDGRNTVHWEAYKDDQPGSEHIGFEARMFYENDIMLGRRWVLDFDYAPDSAMLLRRIGAQLLTE